MKIMKMLLPLTFLLISAPSFATNASLTKTATPSVIVVTTGGGVGLATFFTSSADFPGTLLTKTKTLLGIDWQTTLYPNNPNETVQLCYFLPYTGNPVGCVPITKNSSGTVSNFNNQVFGLGTEVTIRHTVTGGPAPAIPSSHDTVTFRYSY